MVFRRLTQPLARFFRPSARTTPVSTAASPASSSTAASASATLAAASRLRLQDMPLEQIVAAALSASDSAVRVAAVERLPDGEPLRELAGLDGSRATATPIPASVQRCARERLAHLVDRGDVAFTSLQATSDPTAVLSVAAQCRDASHVATVFAALSDRDAVTRLVTDGSSSRVRQLAAERIDDPVQVQQLMKAVREKDKNVYKILKAKSDTIRTEERRLAQIEAERQNAVEALERHAQRASDEQRESDAQRASGPLRAPDALRAFEEQYAATLQSLKSRWQTLKIDATAQDRQRALAAIERCEALIVAQAHRAATLAAAQAEQRARRATIADAQERERAQSAAQAQERLETAARLDAEQTARRDADARVRAETAEAQAQALRQIGSLIGKAHAALRDGQTSRAAGLRRTVEEKLLATPGAGDALARPLAQLDARLLELKTWKEHAVAPKRAELIAEMESLLASTEEPERLAERIRGLQEDWKTISKGIVSDTETDWQRFHAASQAAYQPCREHFEQLAALRRDNLTQRGAILERLEAFERAQSGEHLDHRLIATVLREARQEWRRHSPVERVAGRASQYAFDASLGRLQTRLDTWQADNASRKRALIARARQLPQDSRQAIEGIKQLQQQWQEIGGASRGDEQSLWEEFRQACDAVYLKRRQDSSDHAASLQANERTAIALCDEIERAADAFETPSLQTSDTTAVWREKFASVGELPRADQRGLEKRFEQALARYRARLDQVREARKESAFTHLFEASRLIQTYRRAVADRESGRDPDVDVDALEGAAKAYIESVSQWPTGAAAVVEERWKARTAPIGDVANNERALRLLCVRREILLGIDTPATDHALRREYQMRRLTQGLGRDGDPTDSTITTLALDWVRVDPVPDATFVELLKRFRRSP